MRKLFALLLFLLPACVGAQPYVQQSGNITPGHVPTFATSGVVKDGGAATAGAISEIGITKNGGLPWCIQTALAAPRQLFCFTITDTLATINIQSQGEAAATLGININGTVYPFPGPVYPGFQIRTVSTGTTDSATSLDGTIAWNSATTGAKTETLYACNSGSKANKLVIKDQYPSASTYSITLTPNGSDTIDGSASYILAFNLQSVTIQCNGSGSWLVE